MLQEGALTTPTTPRVARSGMALNPQQGKKTISAPPQLRHHLEGSSPRSPATPGSPHVKKFNFSTGKNDGFNKPPTSGTSSLVTTPRVHRREMYRLNSREDILRTYHSENYEDLKRLIEGRKVMENIGANNHSFIRSSPDIRKNMDSGISQTSAISSTSSNDADQRTVSRRSSKTSSPGFENCNILDSVASFESYSPPAPQTGSTAGDSQSVFSFPDTPSTFPATAYFHTSIDPQGFTQRSFINGKTDLQDMETPAESTISEAPKPTPPDERKKWLISTLSTNLSIIYILFLIIVGIVCYLMDMFSGRYSSISEIFNIYLMTGQITFLAYIHISVRSYVKKISNLLKESNKENKDGKEKAETAAYDSHLDVDQEYGFTDNSHGGSLYLKIGATVFCMGHLIFSGLELASKLVFYFNHDEEFHGCTSLVDIIMSVMLLIYIFYQLFFAFKFSNLIINKRMILSKFGIMHCTGSSICYWIYMIVQETLASLLKKSKSGDYTTEPNTISYDDEDKNSYIRTNLTSTGGSGKLYMGCTQTTEISTIITDSAPYLYPFSIEFNILMVGFWILLWENHGKIEKHHRLPSVEIIYEEDNSRDLASNLVIYVDCHASSRGLFTGLLMSIIAVISIILYIVFSLSESTLEEALLINSISNIIITSIMIVATLFAFHYLRFLDVIHHKISAADDILLYICLPSVFLYAFFIMVPYGIDGDYLAVTVDVLRILQAVLQTALIVDGLRRCSNSSELRRKKPGREVIIFLVVMNVATWLLMSFQIISVQGNALLYKFYGKEVWTAVSHMTLPLSLFYRFHSSVCLADIWKDAYEAEIPH
ncbi:proton channel OtopLc-like [Palaemon carinicauda]|uniref:proton channel OtopLc-like n=1 Tax=Palaemon carinicauda TaxID=392227 RepID=UPI0035B58F06